MELPCTTLHYTSIHYTAHIPLQTTHITQQTTHSTLQTAHRKLHTGELGILVKLNNMFNPDDPDDPVPDVYTASRAHVTIFIYF